MEFPLFEDFVQDYFKVSTAEFIKGIDRYVKIQGEYKKFHFSIFEVEKNCIVLSYDILDINNPRIPDNNVTRLTDLIALLNSYLEGNFYNVAEPILKFMCRITPNLLACKKDCEIIFKEQESKLKSTYPAFSFNYESPLELLQFCCQLKNIPTDTCTESTFIQYTSEDLYDLDKSLIDQLQSNQYFFIVFCLESVQFDKPSLRINFQEPIEAYSIFEDDPYAGTLDNSLFIDPFKPYDAERDAFIRELNKNYPNFDIEHINTIMKVTAKRLFISPKMCNQYNITLDSVLNGNLPPQTKRNIDKDRSRYGVNDLDVLKHTENQLIYVPVDLVAKYKIFYRKFKPIRHPVMRKLLGFVRVHNSLALELEKIDENFSIINSQKFIYKWLKKLNSFIKFCKQKKIYCLYLNINNMWSDQAGNIKVLPSATAPEELYYLAPEELLGNPSENSEMYRLGCFLYQLFDQDLSEMTPNKPEFSSKQDEIQFEIAHRRSLPVFSIKFQTNNPKLCELIRRLMHYNWKSRMNCEELSNFLV